LPFGSVISVNGQSFIVEDRGARSDFGDSRHHNKRVDLFLNSHADARKFGRKEVDVEILSRGYEI
jgi:3D (Asp-Asp-Asp) domain-containing protein